MAIAFGGEFQVKKKPEEVYDFLTSPKRFAPLLPDFQGLEMQDEKNFTIKVKVGVSHIRGTASVKLMLAEADRPRHAGYKGKATLAGGTADMTAAFDLVEDKGWTRVKWKGEAQVFGPLISVAGGLLEPLAKKNIQKLIDSLQVALT